VSRLDSHSAGLAYSRTDKYCYFRSLALFITVWALLKHHTTPRGTDYTGLRTERSHSEREHGAR
jgi:hypothetical protein